MSRRRQFAGVFVGVLVVAGPWLCSAEPAVAAAPAGSAATAAAFHLRDQPIEERLGDAARGLLKGTRRWLRRAYWMLRHGFSWWRRWIKRAALPLAIALIALLADRGLVAGWRRDGLRVLVNYVPLMLYIYGRLLLAPRGNFAAKLLLVAAIVYGAKRVDLIPDGQVFPGRIDDIIVIAFAARVFVYTCPDRLVGVYAERAISLRRRAARLRRRRRKVRGPAGG